MTGLLTFAAGAACALAGWMLPRSGAGSRWASPVHVALDLALPALIFALGCALTARPLFAGVLVFMLCAGYAHSDRSKRAVLAEPIVYTDVFQALDIFRHPSLALPFPDKLPIVGGVVGALILFGSLFVFEPPAWGWTPWPAILLLAAVALLVMLARGPLRSAAARGLHRLGPSGDPVVDASRFGPIGVLFVHAFLAGAGRADVRKRARAGTASMAAARQHAYAPLVLIQCESFFDARRLGPALKPGLLPAFGDLGNSALRYGRLAVPSWGANTVRTEFAVLSGLDPDAIGFDRFNPYHRLAREPMTSLASRMRDQGYRTICMHPFDRRFYGRDVVMPNLGFDEFLDEDAFAGAERINGYVSDRAVGHMACRLLERHGARLFLFIVTMENHGPWKATDVSDGADHFTAAGSTLSAAERLSLNCYLSSLAHADEMFGVVAGRISSYGPGGTLALYGDHLPSFGGAFAKLGLRDHRSDYLIWRPRGGLTQERRHDLSAHELGEAVFNAHYGLEQVTAVPNLICSTGR